MTGILDYKTIMIIWFCVLFVWSIVDVKGLHYCTKKLQSGMLSIKQTQQAYNYVAWFMLLLVVLVIMWSVFLTFLTGVFIE